MDYLYNANEHYKIYALKTQALLWDNFQADEENLAAGISAFPSIHCATAFLFVAAKLAFTVNHQMGICRIFCCDLARLRASGLALCHRWLFLCTDHMGAVVGEWKACSALRLSAVAVAIPVLQHLIKRGVRGHADSVITAINILHLTGDTTGEIGEKV